jgi:hypothetical protein
VVHINQILAQQAVYRVHFLDQIKLRPMSVLPQLTQFSNKPVSQGIIQQTVQRAPRAHLGRLVLEEQLQTVHRVKVVHINQILAQQAVYRVLSL